MNAVVNLKLILCMHVILFYLIVELGMSNSVCVRVCVCVCVCVCACVCTYCNMKHTNR